MCSFDCSLTQHWKADKNIPHIFFFNQSPTKAETTRMGKVQIQILESLTLQAFPLPDTQNTVVQDSSLKIEHRAFQGY